MSQLRAQVGGACAALGGMECGARTVSKPQRTLLTKTGASVTKRSRGRPYIEKRYSSVEEEG